MQNHSSFIPVALKGGNEELVCKDELQFLMATKEIMFFRRSDGWAVLGRDRMHLQRVSYGGEERRQSEVFSLNY